MLFSAIQQVLEALALNGRWWGGGGSTDENKPGKSEAVFARMWKTQSKVFDLYCKQQKNGKLNSWNIMTA